MFIGGTLLGAAAACSSTPKTADTSQPLDRACSVNECFMQREVRDFQVIDETTVVVYVGSQRCAFELEVRGTFCDLTFAPELFFHASNEIERSNRRDPFGAANAPQSARSTDLRICENDLNITVDGGAFTEGDDTLQYDRAGNVIGRTNRSGRAPDRFGNTASECQVTSVASITDDELVELYVKHGVTAPPPPMGTGKIEVGEQKEAEAGGAAEAPAADPSESPASSPTASAPTAGGG
jgi:hypothetical protein